MRDSEALLSDRARMARLKADILRGRLDLLATNVLGLSLLPFHRRVLDFCLQLFSNQSEGLVLAPRGFGKSSLATVCFALWLMLRDRDIRILIISSAAGKAEGFVREIKTQLLTNEVLRSLFGNVADESRWRQDEIALLGRVRRAKEATLTARGRSGAVVGLHFDVHLIDDLVNEDNARTKGQRDKLKDWVYMSLDPTLRPGGCRLFTGTRYHPDDFYAHTERALDKDSVLRLQALQADGSSLWPQKFPVEWLTRKRERMGRIRFDAQYQNDCALMRGRIFRQGDLRHYDRRELDTDKLVVTQGVDLAVGGGPSHDYFALVTKGYDHRGNGHTLDVVRGRYTFREQMIVILYKSGHSPEKIAALLGLPSLNREDVLALFRGQPCRAADQHPRVARIGIEAVAYQRVLPQRLFELAPNLPLVCVPQRLDKRSRMSVYAARFEACREYLPDDASCDALLEELLLFPDGPHDDLADAHEIAHRVAGPLLECDESEPDEDTQVRVFAAPRREQASWKIGSAFIS